MTTFSARTALFKVAAKRGVIPPVVDPPPIWTPQPGPQTMARDSLADVTGYGGAAGGGKTDLLLGVAGTQHRQSIIFRRVFPSMRGIIERSREIFNAEGSDHSKDSFNESLHIWRLADGRMIEFASMQYDKDKKDYQGRPHDYYGFDELTEFTEAQFRFVTAWNRSTYINPVTRQPQRCRVVVTFNPPLDEAGDWVTRYFAAWLDEKHPRPALDGELRWYATLDGQEREVAEVDLAWYVVDERGFTRTEGAAPIRSGKHWLIPVRGLERDGEFIMARSRTFFHATLKDNRILEATGYGATIDALPEPLRSLLKGKFNAARITDPWQTIPTAWVQAAQQRWLQNGKPDLALRAIGNDVARGGPDKTTLARLYGNWFAELLAYPGTATPDGPAAARYVKDVLDAEGASYDETPIFVDAIGIGSAVYDALLNWGIDGRPINFGAGSQAVDKSGKIGFVNLRAEAYWRFREALDPASDEDVMLPDDRELLADLCAPRYKIVGAKYQIEPKEDIKARIGRSPDKGDAVVMAWFGALAGTGGIGGIWV